MANHHLGNKCKAPFDTLRLASPHDHPSGGILTRPKPYTFGNHSLNPQRKAPSPASQNGSAEHKDSTYQIQRAKCEPTALTKVHVGFISYACHQGAPRRQVRVLGERHHPPPSLRLANAVVCPKNGFVGTPAPVDCEGRSTHTGLMMYPGL